MKFLLEILSEEIPARMQAAAAEQLRTRFVDALKAAGLAHGAVTADATPRRLWLIAEDVAAASEGSAEELKGPRADAPAQAIEGFLKKTGLTRDQLEARETPKGAILFAMLRREGRSAAAILAEASPQIIRDFAWSKSMRWGDASQSTASPRWVRPLVGFVALLDGDVVPFTVHGLASGRDTQGHRIHAPGALAITSAETYQDQLRAAHVIASSAERRQIIAARAAELAAGAGLALIPDDGLVAENAGLTEWPVPLLGRFDPDFLTVPPEVIVLTMRTNQKYFALSGADGALAPAFVCVANLDATDGGAAIVGGNQRVLSARLADARFFWDQDVAFVKANGLEGFLPKLDNVVFHELLGTLGDRVRRVAFLSKFITKNMKKPFDFDLISAAATIGKSDIVSATVGEFPELQGVIGERLAEYIKMDPLVISSISDQYRPKGSQDDCVMGAFSALISVADKIDVITSFFSVGIKPTGSGDPFALRRAAISLIKVILGNGIRIPLSVPIGAVAAYYDGASDTKGRADRALELLKLLPINILSKPGVLEQIKQDGMPIEDVENRVVDRAPHYRRVTTEVLNFLADRLKVQQREAGVRHDLIDAVFALGGEDDLVRLLARVKALQAFVETDEGANLLAGYKRAANILKAAAKDAPLPEREGPGEGASAASVADRSGRGEPSPSPSLAGRGAEAVLAAALDSALPQAQAAVAEERFTDAMAALASLRAPVDAFFTDVMVNDPDPAIRARRLALLARFRDAVHGVADFSKIEG